MDAVQGHEGMQKEGEQMKDDLISRQAAIAAIQEEIDKVKPPFNDTLGAIRCGVRLARNIIEDLPSAQPEIIGCEDCKFADEKPIADGRYWCTRNGSFMYYCSDAERRNNG